MYTTSDHIQDFLAEKSREGLSPHTLSYYRIALHKLVTFLENEIGAGCAIEDVQSAHLRRYMASIQESLSPGGVHARLRAVRAFCNWLVEDGTLAVSPMRRLRLPRLPVEELQVVTTEMLRKLLRAAKSSAKPLRNEAILLTLFDSGLRASELVALKTCSVMTGGFLHVVQGKGRKDRVVPVSRSVVKALHRYMRLERPASGLDTLLLGHGGEGLTRSGLTKLLNRLCQDARIDQFSAHAFRRGFVVAYLTNNGDPFSAKRILGHSTLTMVDRYAAMGVEDLKTVHYRATPVGNLGRNPR